jgi:hypothetical protein
MITTYIISDLFAPLREISIRKICCGYRPYELIRLLVLVVIGLLVYRSTLRDGRLRFMCFEETPLFQCFDIYVFLGLMTG